MFETAIKSSRYSINLDGKGMPYHTTGENAGVVSEETHNSDRRTKLTDDIEGHKFFKKIVPYIEY